MKYETQKYSKGVFLYLPGREKNWIEQINFINSLPNINHVEIWIEENLNSSELKSLKSSLKKYEILIHAPWIHLSLISPHQEIREITIKKYLQTLKIADILAAKLVTFHCGSKTIYLSKETTAKIFIQNFNKIKNHYKGNSVFTIENVPTKKRGPEISYPNLSDLMYLKKKLPWLNFTLDVGHAFQDGKNLKLISSFLKKYKNSILDIHLHDATLKGKAHLALSKGELDLIRFLKTLREIDYGRYLSLETITQKDTKFSWRKLFLAEQKLDL